MSDRFGAFLNDRAIEVPPPITLGILVNSIKGLTRTSPRPMRGSRRQRGLPRLSNVTFFSMRVVSRHAPIAARYVIVQCIFCCEQSFLVSCLYYKKGISDQFRRQKYSSLRVESSELASRVLRGFATGIQQPLYAFPLLASRSKGPRKLRPVDAHLTGNGEGPHVRAYRWRGIPPPL